MNTTILWMDEIPHHLRNTGIMISLVIKYQQAMVQSGLDK